MSPLLKLALSLAAIYLAIKLVRWYKRRRRLVRCIDRLPGPPNGPSLPLINHASLLIYLDAIKHRLGSFVLAYHLVSTMYTLFPDSGLARLWLGWKPIVILFSPENVETVLNSTSVINKADLYRVFEPWIGEGLVTSKRNKWRFRRKILTPAFHFRILNDFLPIMNQEADKLVRKLNQPKFVQSRRPNRCVDVAPLVALCTLDTICETAMGSNINSQANDQSDYVQSLYEVGEMALQRVSRPWLWFDWIFYRTEAGRRFTRAKDIMHNYSTKVILERKLEWQQILAQSRDNDQAARPDSMSFDQIVQSSFFKTQGKRLAFLDLMLHQHLVENSMSIDDIREEVDTFMFAGHDTTAMSISWTLYMLGLHEEIQTRVRDEIDSVIGLGDLEKVVDQENDDSNPELGTQLNMTDVSNEHLRELKYLDRVIKESLRMWPSIPFVARQMTEDLVVGEKYLIPEGAECVIFTQALHNNPKYFPKPEVFDPDRFLPENTIGRHPFAYIPFSAGPRNCIGQKFAQMELKVILAKVIQNYFIKTHDFRDKLELVGELVLRSRNGINVQIIPRFRGGT